MVGKQRWRSHRQEFGATADQGGPGLRNWSHIQSNGNGNGKDPFGAMATSVVTITVTDVNEAPMLSGGAASIDRAENGTDLDDDTTTDVAEDGFTVTDEDTVDIPADLRWSLSGADASKFDISTTGGATRTLSFKAEPDYESPGDSGADNVYEVTVMVTDTKGNSDEQDVTVKVTKCRGRRTGHSLDPAAAGWFPGDGHSD